MKVEKKDLGKSQIELLVELSAEEFAPYITRGAEKLSSEIKVEGFRPGKVPFEILKQKIGEMAIIEEGAQLAIMRTIDQAIKENIEGEPVGQPKVDITKIAPNNPLEYKIVIAILPEIKLGDYKNAKVKKDKVEIKESEVEKVIKDLQEMRVKEAVSEEPAGENDKLVVDIQMFLDNVPVEGGQGKDTAIIIGRDFIIHGFDKKLFGAKKDDIREFSLPYPNDYHMKNLAGKMVDFKVTVKEIFKREIPEPDDNFASAFGLKKFDELKENIKKSVTAQKEKENEQKTEKEMLDKILEKSRFGDIPEILVEHEARTMIAELEQAISSQGGKIDDYLASMGKNIDQLTLDLLPEAVKRVKLSLLIRDVSEKEKITAKGEEVEDHIKHMQSHYKNDKEILGKIDTPEYRNYVYNVLTSQKVVEKLKEWNVD
jgi:trigger factor